VIALILHLSQLAALSAFLPGIAEDRGAIWRSHGARFAGGASTASNEIEFSCLNGNLMVPAIHPLTLSSDGNSRSGGPPR
jgi:hypothetical protein